MKKILVPCDFSRPAINAFRYALDIASKQKSTVYLLHVIELPVMHDTVLMPVLNFEEALLQELRDNSQKEFKQLIDTYKRAGVTVINKSDFGPPSAKIIEFISREKIELVVMGSHGARGLREIFIGSNTEKIVRKSAVPVLVVKNYSEKKIKDIVFANTLDTDNQETLVLKVKALQDFYQAKIHIVYINTPLNFTADTATRERLEAFVKRFMLTNCTINIFNHQDEEQGIYHFAKMIDADLIAVGTHGRRGLNHFLNGSLAEDLANHVADKLIWTYCINAELIEA